MAAAGPQRVAQAAARSKGTYLASHYAQIRGRRGTHKAIGAIRHDILVAYYHIVKDRLPYRELGPDWLARSSRGRPRSAAAGGGIEPPRLLRKLTLAYLPERGVLSN